MRVRHGGAAAGDGPSPAWPGEMERMTINVWRVTFYSSAGPFRPSIWIRLRRSELVFWFGWQRPSVLWLK